MNDFLDAEECPFTLDEVHAALRITCRSADDARESAEEYRRIAEEEWREREAGIASTGVQGDGFWRELLEQVRHWRDRGISVPRVR